MPDYCRKLKEIRQSLSMTQEQLAGKLGLTYRAYTSYERNENKPPLTMLDMLLLNFDVNLNWFVSGRGEMFNTSENSAPENVSSDIKDEIIKTVEEYLKTRGI